ncbi:hypothetical protein ACLB2K_017418 [Fragaria x ananassa]
MEGAKEDKKFIRFKFSKIRLWQRKLSDTNDGEYETKINDFLKSMGVPEHEHALIVHSIFRVVEASVSPVDAELVVVWDVTHRIESGQPDLVPASRSSIQALEPVTVLDIDTSQSCLFGGS